MRTLVHQYMCGTELCLFHLLVLDNKELICEHVSDAGSETFPLHSGEGFAEQCGCLPTFQSLVRRALDDGAWHRPYQFCKSGSGEVCLECSICLHTPYMGPPLDPAISAAVRRLIDRRSPKGDA